MDPVPIQTSAIDSSKPKEIDITKNNENVEMDEFETEDGQPVKEEVLKRLVHHWRNTGVSVDRRNPTKVTFSRAQYRFLNNFSNHELIILSYVPNCPDNLDGTVHFRLIDPNVKGSKAILTEIKIPVTEPKVIIGRMAYSIRLTQEDVFAIAWIETDEYQSGRSPGTIKWGSKTRYTSSPVLYMRDSPVIKGLQRHKAPDLEIAARELVYSEGNSKQQKQFIAQPILYRGSDAKAKEQKLAEKANVDLTQYTSEFTSNSLTTFDINKGAGINNNLKLVERVDDAGNYYKEYTET